VKIIFFSFLMPLHLWAAGVDFSGDFVGKGKATMHPKEKVRNCSEIYFQIRQAEKTLHVVSGGYKCEDLEAEFPAFSVDVVGDKLMSDGVQVGSVTATQFTLHTENADEDFTYTLQLTKTESGIHFQEDWPDGGQPALTVEGALK